MNTAEIAAALNLTGVTLTVENGRATITANETVTDAMQAKVQEWHEAGEVSTAQKQATDVVLDRMTDDEVNALTSPTAPTFARRAWLAATSTGIISEADPRFSTLTAALDQAGIIAASRWPALLAP